MRFIELIVCNAHGKIIRVYSLCPNIGDPLTFADATYLQRPQSPGHHSVQSIDNGIATGLPIPALPLAILSTCTHSILPSNCSSSIHKTTRLTVSPLRYDPQLQPPHCSHELRNLYRSVRYSRARAPNPTGLESTRASINGIPISATAGASIEGMPAGTDANAEGALGDASTLGISASAAEFLAAERIPGTGEAEAGFAEA